jgi:hypothetical protein
LGIEFSVELEEALEFLDRSGVVVDADVDVAVHEAGIASIFADDENRSGLFTPFVSSGLLSGCKGGEEPFGEFAFSVAPGVFKGLSHGVGDALAGKDIARDGVVLAGFVTGVVEAFFAGVGGDVAFFVNNEKLPSGDAGVLFSKEGFDFFGGGSISKELKADGAVSGISEGLCGDGSDISCGVGDNAADTEEFALHGDSKVAGFGVVGDNGKGGEEV